MDLDKDDYDRYSRYVDKIRDYADDDKEYGWVELVHEGVQYRFPKRALIWYVFGNMTAIRNLLPEYTPFSYSGMKMMNDDRFHTDVILGSGLYDTYHDALHEAENMVEAEYEDQFRFDFTVLADGRKDKYSRISCMVYEYDPPLEEGVSSNIHIQSQTKGPKGEWDKRRCIVVPRASVEFDIAAINADVIITEVGGPMAHLALVSKEKGKILLRVHNAVEQFPPFSQIHINLEGLTITPRTVI